MIDKDILSTIINDAFDATADAYAEAQIDAMYADIYRWDGTTTYRKSGEIVNSPRDIVDTGELVNSLIQLKTAGARTYIYLAAHALDVHQGYTTEYGNTKPGRPWTEIARQRFIDLEQTMAIELRKRLGSD